MVRCTTLVLLAALAAPVFAQDRPGPDRKKDADLPSACEIRAYYLDKDGRPADASDVKAALIFETKDGKTKTLPMTWTEAKDKQADAPVCRYYPVEGTNYRMAVGATCTDASAPGGNSAYDKPFLKPLPVPIEPDTKVDPDRRDPKLTGAGYYRAYLNEQTISDLSSVPYTDASVQFTDRNGVKKTRCFTCENGIPMSACARVAGDLDTLERQIQNNEMESAKATMAKVRDHVNAVPATTANESVRKDTSACCRELDEAIQAGKRDKALAEIKKLREKCAKCGDGADKDAKPEKNKK